MSALVIIGIFFASWLIIFFQGNRNPAIDNMHIGARATMEFLEAVAVTTLIVTIYNIFIAVRA
jgi:hypothetical protein